MLASGNRLYVGGGLHPGVRARTSATTPSSATTPGTRPRWSTPCRSTRPHPGTSDNLSVTVTSHDNDNDPVTYAYQWTKNGTDIAGATAVTLDLLAEPATATAAI